MASDPSTPSTSHAYPASLTNVSSTPAEQSMQTPREIGPLLGAPKDKTCPFCAQPFTSSSLGRHLDLYIREKNPKPADGVHDVTAIRKLRCGITRRQPRGSLGREGSGTPGASAGGGKRSPETDAGNKSPSIQADGTPSGSGQCAAVTARTGNYGQSTMMKLNSANWTATGVINDISAATGNGNERHGQAQTTQTPSQTWGSKDGRDAPGGADNGGRRTSSMNKHSLAKQGFEQKQKMIEALDTARAAELALMEVLGSIRAAKYATTTLFMLRAC